MSVYIWMLCQFWPFRTGSRIAVDLMAIENAISIFPFMQTLEVVSTHNQGKFRIRGGLFEICKCIYGVRRDGKIKFDSTGSHLVMVFQSDIDHIKPMPFIQQRGFFFERILWTNYKPDFLQFAVLQKVVSYNQMSEMYGIERPEEQTNFFGIFHHLTGLKNELAVFVNQLIIRIDFSSIAHIGE